MEITVNGKRQEAPEGLSIKALIKRNRKENEHLIVEHNGRFVYPQDYAVTLIRDGDRVELIHPDLGG